MRWQAGLGLGLLAGLATLAKLSGLGLWGLMLWRSSFSGGKGAPGAPCWLSARRRAVTALVAGWWFLRNLRLYGDLTETSAMQVFGWREVTPGLAELLGEAEGLRISYWAIFGWFNILSYPLLYKLLDVLLLVAVAGLVYGALRGRRRGEMLAAWGWLSAGWFVVLLVALVRWTRMTSGTQGRLLFPAISAISGLVVYGLSRWLPRESEPGELPGPRRRSARHLARAIALGLGLWAALCFLHIAPTCPPAHPGAGRHPATAQPADHLRRAFRLMATPWSRIPCRRARRCA